MRLLLKYTTLEKESTSSHTTSVQPVQPVQPAQRPRMSWWRFSWSWISCFFGLLFAPRDKPNPLKNAPRMTEETPRHILYRTMDTSVQEIKQLKAVNYSVNDILISCLSGIFAKFGTKNFTEEVSTPVHVCDISSYDNLID